MATTPTTTATADAAGLHAPLSAVADTMEGGCSEYVEGVDVQFWQPSAEAALPLDENGKPAFYQECSEAIRYSSESIYIVYRYMFDELNRLSSLDDDHAHSGLYPTILPCNLPTIWALPLPCYCP